VVGFHELNLSEREIIKNGYGLLPVGIELFESAFHEIGLGDLVELVVLEGSLVGPVFVQGCGDVLY
jgi:hypothetical protein